ncbi:MAG: DegT/DnrJ/EryC1/StrS family aminotransferase [Prochloron sp. SP5CPC1]|nr:DegT/DnrJ/EryC1/StrS family aminotransferase [Candidatus Paraprochloron terpiosi SP5CPC1]
MIPLFKPLIEEEELNGTHEALKSGWLGIGSYMGEGSYVYHFEKNINNVINAPERHVGAVSTGYAALHLGLLIAGVSGGDEVITASLNNIADFQAILATGAMPVFCDIDEETLCIDLDKASGLVTQRTKAIIVMDYACHLCDHEQVADFSKQYNLRVIHDAAHSFGARYQGQMVGSFSDITMFSFDAAKALTCIDGGALVLNSQAELDTLHELRLMGKTSGRGSYDIQRLGYRYHLANPHAAIGLAQLTKLPHIIESRIAACRYYNDQLSNLPPIITPKTRFDDVNPFMYYIRVPTEQRDALQVYLKQRGIETGVHWKPGHHFTLFKTSRRDDMSVTERLGKEILSLPLHSLMSHRLQDEVINGIIDFFQKEVC